MTPHDRNMLLLSCLPVSPAMALASEIADDTGLEQSDIHRTMDALKQHDIQIRSRTKGGVRSLTIDRRSAEKARGMANDWWNNGGAEIAANVGVVCAS